MQIRWKIVVLAATAALGLTALMNRNMAAAAAAPQAQAPAAKAPRLARDARNGAPAPAGISIPDTTLAINSDKPMSERVVHYEIDAKYDAAKHTVDATEVLTYHNLTGQALDHFPFHLYQNAFQPKATFVRDRNSWAAATLAMRSGKTSSTARKTSRASKWWARAT